MGKERLILICNGHFRLPEDSQSPVPFKWRLIDEVDGRVHGMSTEPDTSFHLYGRKQLPELTAALEGRRRPDGTLRLKKIYDAIQGAAPIVYTTKPSDNPYRHEGIWEIGLEVNEEILVAVAEGPFSLEIAK